MWKLKSGGKLFRDFDFVLTGGGTFTDIYCEVINNVTRDLMLFLI